VLVGTDGAGIRQLEAEHNVQLELPGCNLASDMPCSGTFLTIATSIGVRGRKKHVDAAIGAIRRISQQHMRELLELSDEDARLLASLCLDSEQLLSELSERSAVDIDFQPLQNTVIFRGEAALEARGEILQLLAQERPVEQPLECQPTHIELLMLADGAADAATRLHARASVAAGVSRQVDAHCAGPTS